MWFFLLDWNPFLQSSETQLQVQAAQDVNLVKVEPLSSQDNSED